MNYEYNKKLIETLESVARDTNRSDAEVLSIQFEINRLKQLLEDK